MLQSEADTQLDRRRREQELLTALLSPDTRAVGGRRRGARGRPLPAAAAADRAASAPAGASPDAIDRFRARVPVKHALCGEVGGRATCIVGAQASMRGAQLAEALRSVAPEGAAAHVGEGDAVGELSATRAPRTAARWRRCGWPSTATRTSPAGTSCAPTGC